MANPSLQIGNSNWAIKEDNLLGYSTAGTRFLPQPITMTRASAGTRVNSSGLVETVELLGSEKITNGSFVLPNSTWNITNNTGTNTRIENNHLIIETDGTFTQVTELNVLEIGKNYKLVYDVTATDGGNLGLETGGATSLIPSTIGTHTFYWVSNSTTFNLKRYSGALNITIDNVSVKESTKNNLARVDYDGTASSLLVEPQRTNDITNSETFGSTGWSQVLTGTAIAPIVTDNYAISPDGTQNAQRIQFNLGGGTSSGDRTIIREFIDTQTDWFLSVFLKSATGADQKILWHSNSDSNETTITNEWKRYEFDRNGITNAWFGLGLRGSVSTVNTADILVYGFQAEQGSYPTSYIPTSGSTVTRVQDQYSKTGISNLINSEEGVLFAEVAVLSDDSTLKSITLSDSTTGNRVIINYSNASNRLTADVRVGGVGQAFMQTFSYTITNFLKIALKYKENDFALWVNGTEVATDTGGLTFSANTLNRLGLDNGGSGELLFSKVKQLQVFKTALTDTELATLTTI